MTGAQIKVKQANPDRRRGSRVFFADLMKAVSQVKKPAWHQIVEFPEKPQQAYWYTNRLRARHKQSRYEFCATTTDGVGKVFCRLNPTKSK